MAHKRELNKIKMKEKAVMKDMHLPLEVCFIIININIYAP